MKEWNLHADNGSSRIIVGGSIRDLRQYLPDTKHIVISDENVRRLHGHCFSDFDVVEIGLGEKIKTLATVEKIYQTFLDGELDRTSFVVGIGGGIVCDVTGFVASTYMRGVRFGFVPSTLLAQADAGIGGKNGVNFQGYKNIVGVFNQPQFVLCDMELLATLPERELLCGLAEIVKHAVIRSPSLFSYLEERWPSLPALESHAIEKVVDDSLRIKSEIVRADALETGERRKLNFGHTLGHAIERACGLPHGEALSIGMVIAARISVDRGMLSSRDAYRIEALLDNLRLPVELPVDTDVLIDAVKKDKKREGKGTHYVLLGGIGNALVVRMSYRELEKHIHDLREHS